jgi:hypothetical protein
MPQPRVQFVAGVVILCVAISGVAVMIPLMWINPRYREMAPILTVLVVAA